MDEQLQQLSQMIGRARRMAFLGGAGLSTESGIPDFRSSNGVYAALKAYGRPPEELLSHGFFVRHPDVFFDYYANISSARRQSPIRRTMRWRAWNSRAS